MNIVNNFRVCTRLNMYEFQGSKIYKYSFDGQVLFNVEDKYFKTLTEAKRFVKGVL